MFIWKYVLKETSKVITCLKGIPFLFLQYPDASYNELLRTFVLSQEERISRLPVSEGWESLVRSNPTTARYQAYNTFLLDPQLTAPLFAFIVAGCMTMLDHLRRPDVRRVMRSWINIHRAGASLHRHSHYYPVTLVAYYSVYAEGSSTVYGGESPTSDDVEVENKNGQLVVTIGYPNYHEVTTWRSNEPRITIACDVLEQCLSEDIISIPLEREYVRQMHPR